MALTKANFRMIDGVAINVVDYGAVGDDSTDCLAAFTAAEAAAVAAGSALYIPSGVYKISDTFSCRVSIYGDGPKESVIKNYGTNDALDLSGTGYYNTFENFGVVGNASSRDGISLYDGSGNPAYCKFFNVHSNSHGRHGLYHRMAWGTRYNQCMFTYNGGLGVYCDSQSGDAGTHNAVSFYQCDSRWNGGSTSGFGSDAGGVKIRGAAGVYWYGGVVESNNGFGFYIGDTYYATRNVIIQGVYLELNGYSVAVGGAFYVTNSYDNVAVRDCWIGYGADTGNTNTCFFVGPGANNVFSEENNFTTSVGAGTSALYSSGARTNKYGKYKVSSTFGDTGASGTAIDTTLLTVSADGKWSVTGFIYFTRNSDQTGQVMPFIAQYDAATGRDVALGSAIVGTSTAAPTLAFSGDNLVLSTPAYCYAHVSIEDGGISTTPTTFTYGSVFGPTEMRRK